MSSTSNLKRRLQKLNEEEKLKKIKEIALKEELAYWRIYCLKKYRDMKEGGEL